MKFCLRNRQESIYLMKADEIKVDFRDRRSIPDLIEKYPEAKQKYRFELQEIESENK